MRRKYSLGGIVNMIFALLIWIVASTGMISMVAGSELTTNFEDFEEAEFDKFNSYASENGLGGSQICVRGTVHSELFTEGLYALILKQAEKEYWSVGIWYNKDDLKPSFDNIIGKEVQVYGVYTGFSDVVHMPVLVINSGGSIRETKADGSSSLIWSFDEFVENNSEIISGGAENEEETSENVEPKEPVVFEIVNPMIYEGHGTTVTITNIEDGGDTFNLRVNIVNDSDLNLGFNARAYAVNGIMSGNNIYDMDCDVAAHREANTILKLKKDFLKEHNIETVKRIDLLLWAYNNDESFKEFDSGQLTIFTTNDDGDHSESITEKRVYEANGLSVDYLGSSGNTFTFAVTNNTGSYLCFDAENISFNGYTTSDYYFDLMGVIVLNNCQALFTLEPTTDFLNNNGVNDIEVAEFTFNVRPEEDYFKDWNTEMITVQK